MKSLDREQRLTVDLNTEQGRQPGKKPNVHRVIIRQTNEVGFQALQGYLQGRSDFDTSCLEAINVLDHLVRETPSMKYTPIKRSFFARGEQRYNLSPGIEAFKGESRHFALPAAAPPLPVPAFQVLSCLQHPRAVTDDSQVRTHRRVSLTPLAGWRACP